MFMLLLSMMSFIINALNFRLVFWGLEFWGNAVDPYERGIPKDILFLVCDALDSFYYFHFKVFFSNDPSCCTISSND